ncbi:MAG: hypothetical protein JNM58_13460 [Xanthomonadaceae bacterium]|nr:hypothetical protein [Xanthomonadaceae bacterium]
MLLGTLLLSTALAASGNTTPATTAPDTTAAATTAPAPIDCPIGDAKAFEAMMDRTIRGADEARMAAEEEQHRAIDAEADALVADGIWSEQQRGAFFLDVLDTQAFKDEQRLKKETLLPRYMRALQAIAMAASADDCRHVREALSAFEDIIASSKRQYAWMHEQMRAARKR